MMRIRTLSFFGVNSHTVPGPNTGTQKAENPLFSLFLENTEIAKLGNFLQKLRNFRLKTNFNL